jgi:2-oxoglutarate ferredoxin oxidoreductase subunit gamma
MTYEIVLAGFGGQGILFLGKMIATAGMLEGKEVSWIPSYGPEMRGGTANCSVVVSDRRIGTPVVNHPNVLVAMNRPSLEKFESRMQPGGFLLINKTLIEIPHTRTDIDVSYVDITGLAGELGNPRAVRCDGRPDYFFDAAFAEVIAAGGKEKADREPLHVPFERPRERFVEVVDVEG